MRALLLLAVSCLACSHPPLMTEARVPRMPRDQSVCSLGFGADASSVTSDIATVLLFDGAYADGKALIVYQYYRRGINERWAIGGRLYDVRVTSLGPMLNISPPQGGHLVPQVVAVEGGFFVAWQEDESHRLLGRRVGVDGHLGEVVSLPVEGELRLVAHGGQAVALTERTIKDGSCQLERTILTPEARPSEPISTYPHCLTGRPSERPGPDGSPWLTFETEGERKHVWLARLTADGRKVEPPRPITDPGVWDEPRSMLVGDAMLVALVENRPVAGQPMASRIVVRQFDRLGRPIGKAQPIPGAASSTDMHDLRWAVSVTALQSSGATKALRSSSRRMVAQSAQP